MDSVIAHSDEKKTARTNTFLPQTVSESIRISETNREKISLIGTEESPSLRSDLEYLLETGSRGISSRILFRIRRFLSLGRSVRTEYYLTYHQRDESLKKSGAASKKKKAPDFIGDEILQVIRITGAMSRKPLMMFITDFEVGGTRYNREFLQQEGFIPLERFTANTSPKWIMIGAGNAATISEIVTDNGLERYLVIPRKINFKFWDRSGLSEYSYKIRSSSEFLRAHPSLLETARKHNVESAILVAEKILVLERMDSSWRRVGGIFFNAFRRHRDISLAFSGSFFFNIGSGIQQGAIINAILSMMDSFGILILLTWLMQYIYPNIVYTISVILSADRFDRIKSAEKDEQTEPALINLEIKKVLTTVAIYSIISVALLLAIYPGFFIKYIPSTALAKIIVGTVFVASTFFRDWGSTFEQDAHFRILKRSLSGDHELYRSLLKINALAYSSGILLNLVGIAIGWLAMNVSPVLGVSLAAGGVLLAFTKLLYPRWGNDYNLALSMNVNPFYANEKEITVIPGKVILRSFSPLKIHSRGKSFIMYDNAHFEIVVRDRNFIPRMHTHNRMMLFPVRTSWTMKWKHKGKTIIIRILLKNGKAPLSIEETPTDEGIIYRPAIG